MKYLTRCTKNNTSYKVYVTNSGVIVLTFIIISYIGPIFTSFSYQISGLFPSPLAPLNGPACSPLCAALDGDRWRCCLCGSANPDGAAHCYMTFKGRGVVEVGDTSQELEPGTLVYFPPGVPHRLRAHGGPLDYFEIQAWRSFKTNVLSEEPLGLKWYYEPERPDAAPVEWDQS